MSRRSRGNSGETTESKSATTVEFSLDQSMGALVRFTHRAFLEDLQSHLATHDVNAGMWFFLRTLWEEDGITQRELSRRIGISEPTALHQLRKMESAKLLERRRSKTDRRKFDVVLTAKGRRLKQKLLPYAVDLNADALMGIPKSDVQIARRVLADIRDNLSKRRQERDVAIRKKAGPGASKD